MSTTPSAQPILTEQQASGNVLLFLLSAVSSDSADPTFRVACGDARQILTKQRAWSLRGQHLVVQTTTKRQHTATVDACSCGDRTWCGEKILLLVIQTYLSMQELKHRIVEDSEAVQPDEAHETDEAWAKVDSGEASSIFAAIGRQPIDDALEQLNPRAVAGRNYYRAANQ